MKKPIKKPPQSRGVESKYNPEIHDVAAVTMISLGATDVVLAKGLGIARATLNNWKIAYPEFNKKLLKAKDEYDNGVVVKALYKRSVGYEYIETHSELRTPRTKDGEEPQEPVMTIVKTVKKHMAADVTAIIFWLKNRRPNEWRDRHEVTGENGGPLNVVIKHYAPQCLDAPK